MAFNLFNFNKKPIETPKTTEFSSSVEPSQFNIDYSLPIEAPIRTARGFLFGINGLFPQELNRFYNQSPLHSAVINFKKWLTVGQGYTINDSGLSPEQKIALFQLTNQFDDIIEDVALDYFLHSRVDLEVKWNDDFTKLLKVDRISPEKIRILDVDYKMEPTSFIYNWDWTFSTRFPMKTYPVFSRENKIDHCQVYQFQVTSPGMKLYAEPTYMSALNWIVLDADMSIYHKANIMNSLNPSILIQYLEKPNTKEEKQKILGDFISNYSGPHKTGRAMITFSNGKDLAPVVSQMEPNKLDKTFLQLTDTIQRQIVYAHNINPSLTGLKTPGSLGDSTSIEESYKIFNLSVIKPAQKQLENIFNRLIAINGLPVKIKFNNNEDLFESDTTNTK